MPDQIEKDKAIGETVKAACAGTCSGLTDHSIRASVDCSTDHGNVDSFSSYQVIVCEGCKTVSFRETHHNSDDWVQVGENEWDVDRLVRLYPARIADSPGLGKDTQQLPDAVRRLYEETRTTLVNSTPVLSGIGLRALVETVCKQKKAAGDNLLKQIDSLVTMGILTKGDAEVLHHIRSLGNEAAHEAVPHPEEHLALAMEVVEHLLKSVYIIPNKLAKFKKAGPSAIVNPPSPPTA